LVVVLIVLIVSAAALPVVLPAVSHRQVSEAARILQGALVGAHDTAVHNGTPAGIRLLPDPTFNGIDPQYNALNMALPLAANRIIPIEPAPDYNEGMVSIIQDQLTPFANAQAYFPYPAAANTTPTGQVVVNGVLMVEECPINTLNGLPNEPTSWFWNIRVGEKIQIGNSGQSYTVVGPLGPPGLNAQQLQAYVSANDPDLFVNDGPPGSAPQLTRTYFLPNGGQVTVQVEYLFLVNGIDDGPQDGFVDNLWNTTANNGNSLTELTIEFENETWQGALSGLPQVSGIGNLPAAPPANPTPGKLNLNYNIVRRPVPSALGRAIQLPSGVVIDMTTGFQTNPLIVPTYERSRIPTQAFNAGTGSVDILVYPNGQVVPTMNYSTPASVSLNGAFFHFWLAERGDVVAPNPNAVAAPFLPVGNIAQQLGPSSYQGAKLKGEYRLLTVFTRNGQVVTNDNALFDNPANPQAGPNSYNPSLPFLQAQQAITGGQ
jgi:hypothetical protein